LVYANSFWGQFMLDDERSIGDNVEAISSLRSPAKLITSPHYVTRPMVGLSLALSYALGGLRVWAYHLVNLAIHLAAALLLFALARRTLRRPQLRERFAPSATGLALAIALLWLVHPLQTQAVTYIIQRTESLAGLFVLLTVYAVARGADSSRGWPWFVLAVFACLLGMGSKQTAVVRTSWFCSSTAPLWLDHLPRPCGGAGPSTPGWRASGYSSSIPCCGRRPRWAPDSAPPASRRGNMHEPSRR